MIASIQSILPFLVVASHIFLALSIFALVFKDSWGRPLVAWAGRNALVLGLIVSLVAVLGSLFYSNGVGFEPCYLCWWQRVAIYPIIVLFAVAVFKKDRGVFAYVMPLSVIALVVSLYHSYVQWGGSPLIPCDATASCAKLYVYAFGYITIPTMSLTIAIAFILLWAANRVYIKESK